MQTCALVIGGELNGLGVCRSLGVGGVTAYLVDRTRLNPGMWSRHARPVVASALQGRVLIDCLLALQGEVGHRPFLVITDEMAVLTVSEHRDALAGRFRFRLPPQDVVLALHNKARFHEFAVASHLPVPRSEIISHAGDLAKIRTLRLPLIIKPADKRHFHTGRIPRLVTADTSMSAIAACERLLETTGELIVQERTEGPDDSIYFCLFYCGGDGVPVSMFTGRKLASNPPGIGSTAFCMAAAEPRQHLEALTRRFLERIDYAGFGSMEYKWDAFAQRFIIIEPTIGRTDWQEEIATLSGVNIPLDAFRHELAMAPTRCDTTSKSIVWQASYLDRLLVGSSTVPSTAVVFDGYWRADDPLPAIIHYPMKVFTLVKAYLSGWLGALRVAPRCSPPEGNGLSFMG